jgi:hypothetical protein
LLPSISIDCACICANVIGGVEGVDNAGVFGVGVDAGLADILGVDTVDILGAGAEDALGAMLMFIFPALDMWLAPITRALLLFTFPALAIGLGPITRAMLLVMFVALDIWLVPVMLP